jgi:Uma2 family endonuclease
MGQAFQKETVETQEHYTYKDYLEWEDGLRRWELFDGEAMMLAAASPEHQRISRRLAYQFATFLEGKNCEIFPAIDVRLFPDDDESDDVLYVPDLALVCDKDALDNRAYKGPPLLVVEILSPSTSNYDQWVKLANYQLAGVQEYWIVDPETRQMQVCLLRDGKYVSTYYTAEDAVAVSVLPGCTIRLAAVFAQ